MDKIVSWLLVSTLATPLLFGCETSNRNYSQAGRVVDITAQNNNQSERPVSIVEQSLSQSNSANNNGMYVGSSGVSSVVNPNPSTGSSVQEVNIDGSFSSEQNSSSFGSDGSSSGSLVEEEVITPTLPNMSGLNSQFSNATASNNNIYSNATIQGNVASPVSRPAYNQNVTIPGSVSVPQNQTVSNQAYKPAAPVTPASPVDRAPVNEDLTQNSTSSGNWLLLDSSGAKQDAQNTAAEQQALNNSAAVTYQASKTPTAGPDQYRVTKGDTLYSIAFRYGLDYHKLAEINNIKPPYNISVGQVLTLKLQASAPKAYIVQKGDTLYSIAKKNNQQVSVLASVNSLEPPYNISVGQKLYLSREEATSAKDNTANKGNMEVPVAGQQIASTTKPTTSTNTGAATKPTTTTTTTTAQNTTKAPAPAKPQIVNFKSRKVSGVTWSWPTSGRVVEKFSTAEQGNKGVDIEGKRGQAIFSAADGQVVYSGNALRGFGNLIIINHSNEFLSAYAHNEALLVKEGQKVKRGQQIASMGNTDAASVRLHFEIRYRGQSVDPINYLPK